LRRGVRVGIASHIPLGIDVHFRSKSPRRNRDEPRAIAVSDDDDGSDASAACGATRSAIGARGIFCFAALFRKYIWLGCGVLFLREFLVAGIWAIRVGDDRGMREHRCGSIGIYLWPQDERGRRCSAALGFEIAWFRVFSIASSDRAPAFALLLATYLGGIAAGSYLSETFTQRWKPEIVLQVAGSMLLLAGCISVYLPPIVAALASHKVDYLASTPFFFVVAAMLGSVLPILCQLAVPPDENAGRNVSIIYVSNILGSVVGSLGIGFVLMQHFGLREVAVGLGIISVLLGAGVLLFGKGATRAARFSHLAAAVVALVLAVASLPLYSLLYERLIFGARKEAQIPFAHLVENRNGVIGVTREDAVFGAGVYDGYFNVDPLDDSNLVVRAFALSAFHSAPKHMLVIGLASGSWAQIFANHPQVESLDIVEINPGYTQLIPKYSVVRSLLQNPKVHAYVDDGRRWLLAHPDARYDAIIANTTYHWRDHSTGLLSTEFFRLVRPHLNPGGVYYFNTTESDETMATALTVYPYGLRVINFFVVSDSPIVVDKQRWLSVLQRYSIDGKPSFDPINPASSQKLNAYSLLADSVNFAPRFVGMESSESLRMRLKPRLIITDDNMGWEWRGGFVIPWH
jgi:spermidine synthase